MTSQTDFMTKYDTPAWILLTSKLKKSELKHLKKDGGVVLDQSHSSLPLTAEEEKVLTDEGFGIRGVSYQGGCDTAISIPK